MSIRQIQVSYNADQDRVFLVINTNQQESLKFILTRRVCFDILDSVGEHFSAAEAIDFRGISAEATKENPDDDIKILYPLGEHSVLVVKYQVNSLSESNIRISFFCIDKRRVELNIDTQAFNNFLMLLDRVLSDANWGFDGFISEHGFAYDQQESFRFLN